MPEGISHIRLAKIEHSPRSDATRGRRSVSDRPPRRPDAGDPLRPQAPRARADHALPAQHVVFAVSQHPARGTSAGRSSGRSRRRSRSTPSTSNSASNRPLLDAVPRLGGRAAAGRPRHVAAPTGARLGSPRAGARQLARSSPSLAFVLCVPLSILGGVIAAPPLRQGDRQVDHGRRDLARRDAGLRHRDHPHPRLRRSGSAGCRSPRSGTTGAGPLTQIKYLLLPAMTLTLVLFGYIARITRAGVIEALDSDYTRTAYLKGLPSAVVVRKHVLRNALPPDDRRRRRPGRLPLRRARRRRVPLQLPGHRPARSSTRRGSKDLPLLTAGVLVIGTVYLVVTLVADLLYALAQPTHPPRTRRVSTRRLRRRRRSARSEARAARSERLRLLAPLADSSSSARSWSRFWVFCALFPGLVTPYDPIFDNEFPPSQPPSWGHPFGTDTNGRDVFSRVLAGSRDILHDRARRDAHRDRARHHARPHHRLPPRRRRRRHRAGSSTRSSRFR